MVQLSRLGPPLALAAATLLLLGGGAARVASSTAAAGVAGTTAGVQVIGGPRTGGIERVVDVLTHDLGLAEQWLAEGMAERVAFQALERLDEGSLQMHRQLALVRVQRQPAFAHGRLDLSTLGSPRDFTLRHQREGSIETYHLSFLLADYLIERHGFDTMRDYFRRLKRQSSRAAFRSAFGDSIGTFEKDVLAHLRALSSSATTASD